MSELKLRKATLDDVPILEDWDERPHVRFATGYDPDTDEVDDDEWEWDDIIARDPDWLLILIAEVAGNPIGVVQIIDPETEESHYWGDCGPGLRAIDIWIGEESEIAKGYGTVMMQQAQALCFAEPSINAIIIDPLVKNVKALRFYERLGYLRIERRLFGDDDCYVYRLDRP